MTEQKNRPLPPALYPGKVILASGSPRRQELLGLIVPEFEIAPRREVTEKCDPMTPSLKVPIALSQLKSKVYSDLLDADTLLITADTLVIVEGEILGKPSNAETARRMLRRLSGHTHTVVTGVTLADRHHSRSFAEQTKVKFSHLTIDEINNYIEIFHPFDKAGAYGIQEWIGCIGVRGIEGDFYNVMGLPLHALYREIKEFPL